MASEVEGAGLSKGPSTAFLRQARKSVYDASSIQSVRGLRPVFFINKNIFAAQFGEAENVVLLGIPVRIAPWVKDEDIEVWFRDWDYVKNPA